jgi:hypothetical protein
MCRFGLLLCAVWAGWSACGLVFRCRETPHPDVLNQDTAEGTFLWSVTNPTPLGRPEALWDCEELTRDRSAQFNKTQGT